MVKTNQFIERLSKMSPMVIETAYFYAISRVQHGEDVTEKWSTAVQNTAALEKAYVKGYYDGLKDKQKEGYGMDKVTVQLMKDIGYEGCKNCEHQIAPLRMCKWGENGGDGYIHLMCPRWDKKEGGTK